jgi:uncharacterized protein (DUF1015 family)
MRHMTPSEAVPDAHTPSAVPVPPGLVLAPFRALRYATPSGSDLDRVTSPPYDVIDEDERRALEAADPHNVVRLILPRTHGSDPAAAYRRAADLLADWRASGILATDPHPALYVYEMDDGQRRTRGVIGALALAQPEAGIVLPHENTMAGTVADRLALTEATRADLEAIYLVYDGGGATSRVVAAQDPDAALAQAVTPDGITHRLWAVTDPATHDEVAADLLPRRAMIADGHHRYATYLRNQAEHHLRGDGPGPWDYGLVFLVDATTYGPQVHAIHRVLPGLPLTDAVTAARRGFTVTEVAGGQDASLAELARTPRTAFVLTDGSRWFLVTEPNQDLLAAALPTDRSEAWRGLDVTVAHRFLIQSLWGQEDREDVVGYRHDVRSAVETVAATGATALLLRPTPVDAVIAVAAAGERMPRKSTLFTPKPRTGLLMRVYDES